MFPIFFPRTSRAIGLAPLTLVEYVPLSVEACFMLKRRGKLTMATSPAGVCSSVQNASPAQQRHQCPWACRSPSLIPKDSGPGEMAPLLVLTAPIRCHKRGSDGWPWPHCSESLRLLARFV
ncbi:hypothetical protein BDW60DRAFT_54487 [Aspergillus nidulans var. acristatus]